MTKRVLLLSSALVLSMVAGQAQAALVNWDVDSSQSWVRLNLPLNTSTNIEGVGVNLRLRNANNSTWSDAGGRRSNFGGTLVTNYSESANSLTFLQGQQSMTSINFGSFRPNPDQFDPSATNGDNPNGQYTGTGGAPASFAVRVNANALIFVNVTIGYLALRDLQYDAAGTIALTGSGGNFTGSGGQFGVQGGKYDLDANDIGLGLGQLLPDTANGDIGDLLGGPILETNTGGLTITNLGGLLRRLDQTIFIPFNFDVGEGVVLTGSFQGNLVAFATVPEPTSISLLGIAVAGLTLRRRRREVASHMV